MDLAGTLLPIQATSPSDQILQGGFALPRHSGTFDWRRACGGLGVGRLRGLSGGVVGGVGRSESVRERGFSLRLCGIFHAFVGGGVAGGVNERDTGELGDGLRLCGIV